ncbi:MAG: hypothetical protein ACJ73N_14185 [Bryobacteraceae bacterium]
MNESDETKNELRKLREKAMQLNFKMEMNESAETRNELNELREKAIQLSIKMKRQAFSNLARDLARFGLSVPPTMREFAEKDIEETPASSRAFFRDLDAAAAKADPGEDHERSVSGIKGRIKPK